MNESILTQTQLQALQPLLAAIEIAAWRRAYVAVFSTYLDERWNDHMSESGSGRPMHDAESWRIWTNDATEQAGKLSGSLNDAKTAAVDLIRSFGLSEADQSQARQQIKASVDRGKREGDRTGKRAVQAWRAAGENAPPDIAPQPAAVTR